MAAFFPLLTLSSSSSSFYQHHRLLRLYRRPLHGLAFGRSPKTRTSSKDWHSFLRSRRAVPIRTLLALSAAAAAIFLRRKKNPQLFNQARSMASSTENVILAEKFDSHVHVWASPEEAKEYPFFPGQETTLLGSSDDLLKHMDEAGIGGAFIVQPINYMFDHSYVTSVLQKHPNKFFGCLLADPSVDGNGITKLENLAIKEGYKAVRFNPYLWPLNEKMNNKTGSDMFAKAGALGIVVGFMCFKGLLLHIEEIEDLCSRFPSTTVLIDHLGFCKPPTNQLEEESLTRLLQLARFPQVYVKLSAFFRVSRDKFPYRDTWPMLKKVLHCFGAKHLMWGSDYPFVKNESQYVKAAEIFQVAKIEGLITDDELRWIMGRTAQTLLRGVQSKSEY